MDHKKLYSILQALLAALLFGASAPLSKVLLGSIEPVLLASLLYLGSGIGLIIFQLFEHFISKTSVSEAPLTKKEFPWLIGAVSAGGVAAPILLMYSLKITPASTASLLLNFEGAATALIAILLFNESISKSIWSAVILITLASIILSWDFNNQWGFSIGALGILCACTCWGLDNNFTRNVSAKNPYTIVTIKGVGAGSFSLLLAILLKSSLPSFKTIILSMLLGFFSYGLSIVLYVLAMRELGSTRTSAFFSAAPFIGSILSFIISGDFPAASLYISLPFMITGTLLLLKENHVHMHVHLKLTHEHRHCHSDEHHNHTHAPGEIPRDGYHSHLHTHERLEHSHSHTPDIHHRHAH